MLAAARPPAPLVAQRADAAAEVPNTPTAALAGPRVVAALALPSVMPMAYLLEPAGPQVLSARWMPARSAEVVVMRDGVNAGRDVAMMGVGVAGVVIGLAIGGDTGMVIATGSSIFGLVGLYRFLR
jgi:hypothetical protein